MSAHDPAMIQPRGLAAFLRRRPLFAFGIAGLATIVACALFAPFIATHDPVAINFADKLVGPSAEHLFGTDNLGRDIFSRVVYGARTSLLIGAIVTALAIAIGAPLGLLAGYFGGKTDAFMMRGCDVFLAFPPLLLPIAITAAIGTGLLNAMIALAISWFPWYARIMRSSVLRIRSELYVDAARAMGVSHGRVMVRHIVPNAMTPIIVQGSLDFSYTILAAASLSFIGIGAQPPQIEWGLMASQARSLFMDFWWTVTFPGLAIFVTVLSINLIGDGLRDLLDPRGSSTR
ncbi:ABC transporter permease [Hoeflea sp. WL0058]|uniref:ABC transporter permease n=2 Tax=Flavimaribacter sediminis TaxID=2865987 RepID=A0AAE3D162_9HYPH|nr:ABC transporter permease [Flavimaribacter sediminis]